MIDKIVQISCHEWGLPVCEVLGKSRKMKLFFARVTIAKMLRKHFKISLMDIGVVLNRHHATIIYYLDTFDIECKYNKEFREIANKIEEEYNKLNNYGVS